MDFLMCIKKIIFTIFVCTWMLTVFFFSHQQGTSSSNTSKNVSTIIINILDIKKEMLEDKKTEIVQIIEPIIRKLAHYTLYMIGGILIINCIDAYIKEDKKNIIYSLFIGILYSISDELHQLFINGRSGKILDVIIDSVGVFTGILIYWLVKKKIENIVNRKKYKGSE